MMLVHVALIVFVAEAWSLDRVVKYSSLKLGMDANLTCGNKTWTKMIFVIWKLSMTHKYCEIKSNIDGRNEDTCEDGKSLRNTSEAQPFLHIPDFSVKDTGVYVCESIYAGGAENYKIYVNITARPLLSAWIEWRADKKVAVCRAERGKPAANISWAFTGNSTVETHLDPDGLITVESFVELDANVNADNLSCAISHPYWDNEQLLFPKPIKGHNIPAVYITTVISVAFCLALLFLGKRKLKNLRGCQKSSWSSSRSPPIEDVEEVEPYESYVQRVNSIYNSSRDLFT